MTDEEQSHESRNIEGFETATSTDSNAGHGGTGCVGALFGIVVWVVFLAVVFFPGAGPFTGNSAAEMFALLAPTVAFTVWQPKMWSVAPISGVLNVILLLAATKGMSTGTSTLVWVGLSLLWLILIVVAITKPSTKVLSHSSDDEA